MNQRTIAYLRLFGPQRLLLTPVTLSMLPVSALLPIKIIGEMIRRKPGKRSHP